MSPRVWFAVGVLLAAGGSLARTVRADGTLYRYEGNVLPHDPSEGWEIFQSCDPPCSESIANGRFIVQWPHAGDFFNYVHRIAQSPEPPPPSLWVEWRFRSNHPLGQFFFDCDGRLTVQFASVTTWIYLYGDAAISNSGDHVVSGLELNDFHTYRFECLDGSEYRFWVNGRLIFGDNGAFPNSLHHIRIGGEGGCFSDQIPNMVNEWDYVRYGTISSGEQIVSVDPAAGQLGPQGYTSFTTFRVTFDAANYVYIDDIAVSVTGGTAPIVTATRRRETDDVDTVEIVLDRPLPNNQRTRFTFTDASGSQQIDYDFREPVPPVPAMGTAGSLLTAGVIVLAGIVAIRRRMRKGECGMACE